MCMAHAELALDVFEVMAKVHSLEQVFDYVPGGWDSSPAMAILPFYVTIKELLRGKTASLLESGWEGGSLTIPASFNVTNNVELAVHDSKLQTLIDRTGNYMNSVLRVVSKHEGTWSMAAGAIKARVRLAQHLFTAILRSSTVEELNQQWGLILDHAGARWRALAPEAEEPTLDLPFTNGNEGVDGLMPKFLGLERG
ncbi:hypothetical protein M427DRAFT_145882 [Gonapodya prolifera JEL478]|uniref:Uncharacterized protein n=1 Tax=Gonapodya prolifera (strain JEL478) TaxID=1344416 RepID=A0A139AD37_GONPJ|nr:hypothetical protein M427DRAFT_145882 [Gonapodya prolifera JEL478]|eukprot:KXS14680.1 hypothetical protein M427DRAFT_145882 [Gonapodya prolifera JEL478]